MLLRPRTSNWRSGNRFLLTEGHDGMRDVSDVSSRVPRLPPFPGVVDDLEELSPEDGQLFVVARGSGVGHAGYTGPPSNLERIQ